MGKNTRGRSGVMSSSAALPCALGFGTLLAFSNLMSILGIRLPVVESGVNLIVLMRLVEAAAFLAVAVFWKGFAGLCDRRFAVWACAALCALSALTSSTMGLFAGGGAPAILMQVLASLLRGAAPALLWMLWIELYARMDARHVLVYFLAAQVVSGVLTLAVSLPDIGLLAYAPVALLPVVCAALLQRAVKEVRSETFAQGEALAERHAFPWAPVLLMAVFSFANVFARDMLPGEDRAYATLGLFACLAVLVFLLRANHGRAWSWSLYGVAFPLTLAGLFGMLLTDPAWGIAATVCTHAGEALFTAFIVTTLCNISYRYGVSALLLFGFAQAAGSLANLAAWQTAQWASEQAGETMTLAAAAVAIALAVCYVALTRRAGEATWGVDATPALEATRGGLDGRAAGLAAGAPASAAARPASWRGELEECCSCVAYEHGLTKREEEVLVLLAQDRTAQQIEDELCVTNSTVKSHTNAVYRKLGLHSRNDLVAAIEKKLAEG